jgi:hypothetical protein
MFFFIDAQPVKPEELTIAGLLATCQPPPFDHQSFLTIQRGLLRRDFQIAHNYSVFTVRKKCKKELGSGAGSFRNLGIGNWPGPSFCGHVIIQ